MDSDNGRRATAAVVRLAAKADRPKLAFLRSRWTSELGIDTADPSFRERFETWIEQEQAERRFWIAEAGGEPVGMVNLLFFERMPRPGLDSSRWAYLANMYVVPEHRGSGVSQLLVGTAVDEATLAGCERVVLSPSERSVSFWRKLGFGDANELLVNRPQVIRRGDALSPSSRA
jgi:GNAT superfamily N-acetyltransferase